MYGSIAGNIAGTLYFLYFQLAGIALISVLFDKERPYVKLLMGSVAGSVLLMWIPTLFSFLFDFTLTSHFAAAVLMIPILMLFIRKKVVALSATSAVLAGKEYDPVRKGQTDNTADSGSAPIQPASKKGWHIDKRHAAFFILFALCMVFYLYLLYTHTIRLDADGSIYTGQATYGDMNMHLGFITSIATQHTFPPDYSIMPGVKLSYPFLCDSISSSVYLFGASLKWAYILPMLFAMAQIFCTVYLFAQKLFHSVRKSLLAFILFFFNGGLGIIYFLDQGGSTEFTLAGIFTGYYTTPTNLSSENIRWVNVIADMFLPQRATLFGYSVLFMTLYLLYRAIREQDRRKFILVGLLGGALPMIHTHSFLALAMISAVWLLWYLADSLSLLSQGNMQTLAASLLALMVICMTAIQYVSDRYEISDNTYMVLALFVVAVLVLLGIILLIRHIQKNDVKTLLSTWGIYLVITLLLALPQLFYWTFGQVSDGGFVRGYFNWGNNGDPYIWFYLKNIGVVLILIILAYCAIRKRTAPFLLAALFIWTIAELIVFTPNTYDNNKLLYVAYLMLCFAAADVGVTLYDRLKFQGKNFIAAAFLFCCMVSAVLTLGREAVSEYQLYPASQVALAEYVEENLPADAVILTNDRHNNTIASLTGRNIVCGAGTFLYYHGYPTTERQAEVALMYADPLGQTALYEKYNVSYVLISAYERNSYDFDETVFEENYELVYSQDDVNLYKFSEE